jgi:hypothetical protein
VYASLWHRIPGGLPGKLAGMSALLVTVLALLFFVVFPLVEPQLPWNDVNVNTPPLTSVPSAVASPSASN